MKRAHRSRTTEVDLHCMSTRLSDVWYSKYRKREYSMISATGSGAGDDDQGAKEGTMGRDGGSTGERRTNVQGGE